MLEHTTNECECEGKQCTKCEKIFCCGFFARNRRRSENGLQPKCKNCNKAYAQEHHTKIQEYKAEYRQVHSADLVKKQTAYYLLHHEEKRHYLRDYYQRTKDAQRENRCLNVLVRKARKRQSGGTLKPHQWKASKAYYRYTCLCCGKQEPEIKLTIDHVIPVAKGGRSDVDNIQPLCFPCNRSKGIKIIDYRLLWLLENEV